MFGIGTQELLIIFLIVLLLFGANRIPEIGRAMGKGIRDFKRATKEIEDEFKPEDRDTDRISGSAGSAGRAADAPRPTQTETKRS